MNKYTIFILTLLLTFASSQTWIRCGYFAGVYQTKPCDLAKNCNIPFGSSVKFQNLTGTCASCNGNTSCILNTGRFDVCSSSKNIEFNYFASNRTCYVTCKDYNNIALISQGTKEYGTFWHWNYMGIDCAQGYGMIVIHTEPDNSSVFSSNFTSSLLLFLFFLTIF